MKYILTITSKGLYGHNESVLQEFSSIENLLKQIEFCIKNEYITKNDILRINKRED